MQRALVYTAGWLAAVVVATAVGFVAISLVGDDVGAPSSPVALTSTPEATATEPPADDEPRRSTPEPTRKTSTVSGSSGSVDRQTEASTRVTEGGTVTGVCRSGAPRLRSWSPKNGWSVVEVDNTGENRFVVFSDDTQFLTVRLLCIAGTADFVVTSASPSPSPTPTDTSTPTPTETPSVDPGMP